MKVTKDTKVGTFVKLEIEPGFRGGASPSELYGGTYNSGGTLYGTITKNNYPDIFVTWDNIIDGDPTDIADAEELTVIKSKPKLQKKSKSESKLREMIRTQIKKILKEETIRDLESLKKYLSSSKNVTFNRADQSLKIDLGNYENDEFNEYMDDMVNFYKKYKNDKGIKFYIARGDDAPNSMIINSNFDVQKFTSDELELLLLVVTAGTYDDYDVSKEKVEKQFGFTHETFKESKIRKLIQTEIRKVLKEYDDLPDDEGDDEDGGYTSPQDRWPDADEETGEKYPKYSDVAKYIISKKPKDKKGIEKLIGQYLKINKIKYLASSFEEYNYAVRRITSYVADKLNISTQLKLTKSGFKKNFGREPKVGLEWKEHLDAPATGYIKIKVLKIDGDTVYYDVDNRAARELSADDVR